MKFLVKLSLITYLVAINGIPSSLWAIDAPHDGSNSIDCLSCHKIHHALGGTLNTADSNPNLCMTCHNPAGLAAAKSMADVDRANPFGTADGRTPYRGVSHPWNMNTVNENADATTPGDLQMSRRLDDGNVICSTCHNQHNHNTGSPFMRASNVESALCKQCHGARDVTSSSGGSHPVGVPIPTEKPFFKTPTTLALENGNVQCMTCHSPHYATSGGANGGAGDGYLLDMSLGTICTDCHAFTGAPSHFNATTGALWPGAQYGTNFANVSPGGDVLPNGAIGGTLSSALPTSYRGTCINCHWPHGWKDPSTGTDYNKLWVENEEKLCYTCHDGTPASTNIRSEFLKGTNATKVFHHPIDDTEQGLYGRSVECFDCHNPHQANNANKIEGASGTNINGDPVGPPTVITQQELCFKCHGDTFNAGRDIDGDGHVDTTNKRLDFQADLSAYHPVSQPGRNQSETMKLGLLGGLTETSTIKCTDCHNSNATSNASGPASNSTASPQGPHGSTSAPILRANYNLAANGPDRPNLNNFTFCFLCHSQSRLFSDSSGQSNYNQPNGRSRDNLHNYHINDNDTGATCRTCHFNIHSNRSAGNTIYRIIDGGTTDYQSPPTGYKTRLVNFSPYVTGNSSAKPMFRINVGTRQRGCNLRCHGENHSFSDRIYTPSSTYDNDSLTY